MRMRRLRRRRRARPQRRRQVDVPLLEREVEFWQRALARCEGDAGLEGVDGREEAGGDLHELASGVRGRGAVCGWELVSVYSSCGPSGRSRRAT